MLIFDEKISSDSVPAWDHLAEKHGREKVLMFDLETTGFSPVNSFIYIIGINLWKEDSWHIIQLFNDDGKSEPEMIAHFMELLENKTTLFHFNGDRFDIPFVLGRMEKIINSLKISIPDRMSPLDSVDFFKEIKPFKYALGLPNVKQKTVEKYLGIYREDQYDGGQLINVYLSYLSSGSKRNRDLVLLHNRDDMEGMYHLARIRALTDLCDGAFQVGDLSMLSKGSLLFLELSLAAETSLPTSLVTTGFGATLRGEAANVLLQLPIHAGCCTCCITKDTEEGYFLPDAGFTGTPLFHDPKAKKVTYIAANDTLLGNAEHLKEYAACCIRALLKPKRNK